MEPEVELTANGPAAEGASDLDSALKDALSPLLETDTGVGTQTPPAEPAAPKAEVHTLPPGQRKRTRTGRKSRRELEREVKDLRAHLKLEEGEETPAAPPPPPPDYEAAGDFVVFILDMVFEGIAAEKGEHWRLDDLTKAKAKEHGGKAFGPILPKLGALLPWIFFGGVVGKATIARVRIDMQKKKETAAPAPAAAPPPAGGVH